MAGKKWVRIALDVTEDFRDRVIQIQRDTEATSTVDVMKSSFSLYELVTTAIRNGSSLQLRDNQGNITELKLL